MRADQPGVQAEGLAKLVLRRFEFAPFNITASKFKVGRGIARIKSHGLAQQCLSLGYVVALQLNHSGAEIGVLGGWVHFDFLPKLFESRVVSSQSHFGETQVVVCHRQARIERQGLLDFFLRHEGLVRVQISPAQEQMPLSISGPQPRVLLEVRDGLGVVAKA